MKSAQLKSADPASTASSNCQLSVKTFATLKYKVAPPVKCTNVKQELERDWLYVCLNCCGWSLVIVYSLIWWDQFCQSYDMASTLYEWSAAIISLAVAGEIFRVAAKTGLRRGSFSTPHMYKGKLVVILLR